MSGGSAFAPLADLQNAATRHKLPHPRELGFGAMARWALHLSSIPVIHAFDAGPNTQELIAGLELTHPVSQFAYRTGPLRVKDNHPGRRRDMDRGWS